MLKTGRSDNRVWDPRAGFIKESSKTDKVKVPAYLNGKAIE